MNDEKQAGKRLVLDNDGLHRRGGVWYYKLKIGGKWKEYSTHKTKYQEARQVRADALEAQKQGRLPADKGKLPFEKAAEAWLAARQELKLAANTVRTEKERMPPLLARFSGRRLNTFTDDDWKGYQIARAKEVSNRTVNLELEQWRMILKDARCWVPLVNYKPLRENTQGPGIALTLEEERRLFETARQKPGWDAAYYAALMAANTTMRGCEVKGLHLSDVDLFNRTITVQRATTKTDAGRRLIPMNDTALWAAARLLERASLLGASDPEHYLFPAFLHRRTKQSSPSAGTGFDPARPMKTWRTAWRSLRKRAGLPTLRFHDLRHTCITKLAEEGTPDHTLMAISGHISSEMIRHYSHIRSKAKEAAVARMKFYEPPEVSVQKVTPTGPVS